MLFPVFLLGSSASLRAQCSCATTVGSGAGIATLTAAISVYGTGFASLTGTCVKINGTFTIDNSQTWTLNAVNVYALTTSSQIVVNNGCTLNAGNSSLFDGCSGNTWAGIRSLGGSTTLINNCRLQNVTNSGAVFIAAGATFTITNNTFNENGVAIKIAGTQSLGSHTVSGNQINRGLGSGTGIFINSGAQNITIGNNIYFFPAFTIPSAMTGVVISTNASNISILGGTMVNQDIGVDIKTGARGILIKNLIFGGGTGVFANNAWGALTIIDGTFRAREDGLYINQHATSAGPTVSGDVNIARNDVSSAFKSGIRILTASGNRNIFIRENFIRPNTSNPAAAAYGIGVTNSHNPFITIEGNTVEHTVFPSGSAIIPGGIYVQGSDGGCIIRNNLINTGYTGHLQFGITVAESNNIQVVGNTVNPAGNNMNRGIAMENNPNNQLLCCNSVDKSLQGLYMLGAQENTDIFNTVFGMHGEALYYDMVTTSSANQTHRGNDWSSATTTWDGYFNGSPFLAPFAFYTVDPAYLANTTKIFVTGGTPSDWFLVTNGSEASCVNTFNSFCGEAPLENGGEFSSPGGEEALTDTDYWAASELDDASYQVIHWYAQRALYQKLLQHPELRQTEASIAGFWENAENSNLAKFYTIEDQLYRLYDGTLDESGIAEKLSDLETLNDAITPALVCEAHLQAVNAIEINALALDDWDFDAEEKNTIDGIAALCPQEGGPAVYAARDLQEKYRTPVWNMDCAAIGAREAARTTPAIQGMKVYPNPTADLLWLDCSAAVSVRQIRIVDITGRVRQESSLPAGATHVPLQVGDLPNGCYALLLVAADGHSVQQQKVNIIR